MQTFAADAYGFSATVSNVLRTLPSEFTQKGRQVPARRPSNVAARQEGGKQACQLVEAGYAHLRGAGVDHAKLRGGGLRYVDDPAAGKGAAVIDP